MTSSIIPDENEHLITGWEPDVPADDTLVRQAVLAHASWPVEVARALGRPWQHTDRWAGGWVGDRGPLTNLVMLLQPLDDPAGVTAEIGEMIPAHVPYCLVSPWPTPDLRPQGLVLLGHPPLMVRFPAHHELPAPHGVEVREVGTAEELAVAEQVLVGGYPMPELEPLTPGSLLAPAILDGLTRVWLGHVDGRPASVAAAFRHTDVTLVEYVAALPNARGRGAGAAVTWAATLAEPDSPVVLMSSDEGRPVYEGMGFIPVERWTAWLRP